MASIMIVFGRLMWSKRTANTSDSTGVSVSELSTTVDTMGKFHSGDAIVVTSMANDTPQTTNISNSSAQITPANVTTKEDTSETASDIDLSTPLSIPSISNRNNVSYAMALK